MSLKVTGRLFHNFVAAIENALSPYVVLEDRGTADWFLDIQIVSYAEDYRILITQLDT